MIYASDGNTVLARSRGRGRGQSRTYTRTYPTGGLFGHPVGFSYIRNGRRGLELSRNDDLVGEEDEFESILAGLESRDQEGNDLVTNLDVQGTEAAVAGLAGRKGAVVAIEPKTGKVRVMVSVPEYDPNLIPSQIGQLNQDRANQPLLNRTTQELYPPGSTFKVVTATAGLDTGNVSPETVIDGSSPREISGVPLENAGGADFGQISFTDALTNSVNTVFAQVGERVGRDTLVEYMRRFGFYEDPPARLSERPDDRKRRSSTVRAITSTTASTSGAWRSGRAASRARSAPGRSRWRRWLPPWPTGDG